MGYMQELHRVVYEDIVIPDISQHPYETKEGLEQLLVEFQGSFINIQSTSSHYVSALRLFDQIQDVVEELVITTPNNEQYLVLTHINDKGIRDSHIITDYAIVELNKDSFKDSIQPFTISLSEFWPHGENYHQAAISEFLQNVINGIQPTAALTLSGYAPLVAVYTLAFLLRGVVGELWYEVDNYQQSVKIF